MAAKGGGEGVVEKEDAGLARWLNSGRNLVGKEGVNNI